MAPLVAPSTPSLASNQVIYIFKPSRNSTLSPSRIASTRQSVNRSVIAAAASGVTDYAPSMIGTPYRWGGTTPKKSFDYNGLASYMFWDVDDADLLRATRAIYNMDNNKVSCGRLQPGDLIFFRIHSRGVDHVGIYVDNDRFVHAPWRGKKVHVSDLNSSYWKCHYLAGKHILPATPIQVENTRKC